MEIVCAVIGLSNQNSSILRSHKKILSFENINVNILLTIASRKWTNFVSTSLSTFVLNRRETGMRLVMQFNNKYKLCKPHTLIFRRYCENSHLMQ